MQNQLPEVAQRLECQDHIIVEDPHLFFFLKKRMDYFIECVVLFGTELQHSPH